MAAIKKLGAIIERIFSICTALCFAAVALIVLIQILARYIPGLSANWSDELGRLMFFYTIMFGAPLGFGHGEYPYIDVLIANAKGRVRHAANTVIYCLCAVTASVIFMNSFKFFKVGTKTVSTALGFQMTWFYGPIIALFAFSAVGAFVTAIRELIYTVKGDKE